MADYTTHIAQARRLRELGYETHAEMAARNRARYAAYRWLAEQPTGQLLLDDWCLELLKPSTTPEDVGEKRFIQKVLRVIRDDAPRALEEDPSV